MVDHTGCSKEMKVVLTITILWSVVYAVNAQPKTTAIKWVIVDAKGKGDFKTIQGAINSLADSSSITRHIYIRNGIYKEKIYLEKHNIIIEGENREKTVITQAIAR